MLPRLFAGVPALLAPAFSPAFLDRGDFARPFAFRLSFGLPPFLSVRVWTSPLWFRGFTSRGPPGVLVRSVYGRIHTLIAPGRHCSAACLGWPTLFPSRAPSTFPFPASGLAGDALRWGARYRPSPGLRLVRLGLLWLRAVTSWFPRSASLLFALCAAFPSFPSSFSPSFLPWCWFRYCLPRFVPRSPPPRRPPTPPPGAFPLRLLVSSAFGCQGALLAGPVPAALSRFAPRSSAVTRFSRVHSRCFLTRLSVLLDAVAARPRAQSGSGVGAVPLLSLIRCPVSLCASGFFCRCFCSPCPSFATFVPSWRAVRLPACCRAPLRPGAILHLLQPQPVSFCLTGAVPFRVPWCMLSSGVLPFFAWLCCFSLLPNASSARCAGSRLTPALLR